MDKEFNKDLPPPSPQKKKFKITSRSARLKIFRSNEQIIF